MRFPSTEIILTLAIFCFAYSTHALRETRSTTVRNPKANKAASRFLASIPNVTLAHSANLFKNAFADTDSNDDFVAGQTAGIIRPGESLGVFHTYNSPNALWEGLLTADFETEKPKSIALIPTKPKFQQEPIVNQRGCTNGGCFLKFVLSRNKADSGLAPVQLEGKYRLVVLFESGRAANYEIGFE